MVIYLLQGLCFFALGWAVLLESRHDSSLPLGHHLRWLGVSAVTQSLAIWLRSPGLIAGITVLESILLLLETTAAILLIRFGIGLVGEAGPLPEWMELVPAVLFVPLSLIVAYALVVLITGTADVEVWLRRLLVVPGALLAAFGFYRQWRGLRGDKWPYHLMLGAACAFAFEALVSGLASAGQHDLIPWFNASTLYRLTGITMENGRLISSFLMACFVIGALNVFQNERQQQIKKLEEERREAEAAALNAESLARHSAEDWINGLVLVSRHIANLNVIDDVLIEIVGLSRRLLHAETAALALSDSAGSTLVLKCYATAEDEFTASPADVQNAVILAALKGVHSLNYLGKPGDTPWICPIVQQPIKAAVIVPLRLDNRLLGGIWVTRYQQKPFSETDVNALERLSDQAVIALEHGLMAARLQSVAVLEERSRIAREMHDGLAQILGYISLEMQTLAAMIQQHDETGALNEIRQAREMIKTAQADVRENILSLRTTLSGEGDLIGALRQYVDEFGIQTGMSTDFICNCQSDELALSALAETQLVRIVQEALTNIRKHARAKAVQVQIVQEEAHLQVFVEDDGIGFAELPVGNSHFGLLTMRERAQSVGGNVQVTSVPGTGTCVAVEVPLLQRSFST
jgi:signal transduction histidine kinase